MHNRNLIALSTNDYQNLSSSEFGKSHYYKIFRLEDAELTEVEIRENVLFMRSCDLNGRAEHLHGLLGDVTTLIGAYFDEGVRKLLQSRNHRVITISPDRIEEITRRLPELHLDITPN